MAEICETEMLRRSAFGESSVAASYCISESLCRVRGKKHLCFAADVRPGSDADDIRFIG